jgi:hypothetical protein
MHIGPLYARRLTYHRNMPHIIGPLQTKSVTVPAHIMGVIAKTDRQTVRMFVLSVMRTHVVLRLRILVKFPTTGEVYIRIIDDVRKQNHSVYVAYPVWLAALTLPV